MRYFAYNMGSLVGEIPACSGRQGGSTQRRLVMKKQFGLSLAILAGSLLHASATAVQTQPVADFREAITQAVLTNPRVSAAWYNFEATREAQRAAEGGYFPSVDLSAEIGRE